MVVLVLQYIQVVPLQVLLITVCLELLCHCPIGRPYTVDFKLIHQLYSIEHTTVPLLTRLHIEPTVVKLPYYLGLGTVTDNQPTPLAILPQTVLYVSHIHTTLVKQQLTIQPVPLDFHLNTGSRVIEPEIQSICGLGKYITPLGLEYDLGIGKPLLHILLTQSIYSPPPRIGDVGLYFPHLLPGKKIIVLVCGMKLNEIIPVPVIVYPEITGWIVIKKLHTPGPYKQLLYLFLTYEIALIHIQYVPGSTVQLPCIVGRKELYLVVVLEGVYHIGLVHLHQSNPVLTVQYGLEIPYTSPLQMGNTPGHHTDHQVPLLTDQDKIQQLKGGISLPRPRSTEIGYDVVLPGLVCIKCPDKYSAQCQHNPTTPSTCQGCRGLHS